jgi:hypothetical protein
MTHSPWVIFSATAKASSTPLLEDASVVFVNSVCKVPCNNSAILAVSWVPSCESVGVKLSSHHTKETKRNKKKQNNQPFSSPPSITLISYLWDNWASNSGATPIAYTKPAKEWKVVMITIACTNSFTDHWCSPLTSCWIGLCECDVNVMWMWIHSLCRLSLSLSSQLYRDVIHFNGPWLMCQSCIEFWNILDLLWCLLDTFQPFWITFPQVCTTSRNMSCTEWNRVELNSWAKSKWTFIE